MRDTASRNGENALSYNLIAYHKIKKYGKTDEEREASGKFYLGEPIKVNYYPHKLLKKDANMVLFTVICSYQTTQACPFSTGTEVYLISTKPSGEAISAVVIAEDSEASDPPMSSEYTAKCDVKNLTEPINVKIVSNVAEDDPDKPVKTVSTKKVTIGSDGKLSVAEK